jgi:putative endopeptidase
VLRGLRYREKLSFSAVGKPIDRTRGVLGPLVSGASYSPEQNEVEIPAAEIQPPNFVPDASDAENYARLGFVVGHEVTHAFDDEGRHYDGLGALRNWWTSNDSMNFGDRAACFVKKYGALSSSGGQHINGILTLGENLADNGGLRLAYMAFLADAHEKGIDLDRVQRGYTPRQEFFLSFAQYWCETIRPEQELRQIQGNPHTPDRFRGIEVLKNLPDFGDAFGCKAGKPMTPEDHCRVW